MGHYAGKRPSSTANARAGSQSLQVGLNMPQTATKISSTDIINTNWILLDTCYTISSVIKSDLVQDIFICDSGKELRTYTNRRHQDFSYTYIMRMIPFEVFNNEKPLVNKLSFGAVELKFRFTIDTELELAINV